MKLCDDASLFYGIVNSFYDIIEWISGKVVGGPIIIFLSFTSLGSAWYVRFGLLIHPFLLLAVFMVL